MAIDNMETHEKVAYLGLGLMTGGWLFFMLMLSLTGHWVWLSIFIVVTGFVLVRLGMHDYM